MDFALTDEQAELKAAARRYLERTYPLTRIAELADTGERDTDAWPELFRQGWFDPGLGVVEAALLAEEGGRALHPVPWWASAGLALPVYRAAGADLPGPATVADNASGCRAFQGQDGEWRLDGAVSAVVDGDVVDHLVVPARTDEGMALFALCRDTPGVSIAGRAGIDPLRTMPDLALTDARAAARLVGPPSAAALLTSIDLRATALLACEAVGVADRALEFAVEHATSRVQFDRPIGSFQAVSQLLAESYAELELARSLGYRAACAVQAVAEDVVDAVACAAHAGGRAAVGVCEAAIQVCGGMGVTWEFPLHWWFRRALWLRAVMAERSAPLATLARGVFDDIAGPAISLHL